MNRRVVCPTDAQLPYDEVSHEIDNNVLTFKLPKDRHRVQAVDEQIDEPIIDVNCLDKYGKKCKKGCPKINVIHNQEPTPKKPEEEMLLLRTTRQITRNITDNMKHSLEVEFKSPRNYIPLPEPEPISIYDIKKPVVLQKLEKNKGKKKELIKKLKRGIKEENKKKTMKINIKQHHL